MKVLANVEAAIDFSDEELPKNIVVENLEQTKNKIIDITNLIKNSDVAEKIRNGFIIAIVGKTNTGKSSFINKIAKSDLSVASTGIAGPSGGTPLKHVGLVYIGIKFI